MEILKLQPIFKDYIWGGQRLREDFEIQSDLPKLAEGWMLACHQAGMNTIDGGSYDGQPLFLLSEVLLGTGATGEVIFYSKSNVWQDSEARSWCGNFSTTSFTVSELDAVLKTTKSDAAYTPSAST